MTNDDFGEGLRRGLATLAREAVPDGDAATVESLPRMQTLPSERRRVGKRTLAAVIAAVVAAGSGAIALAVHDDSNAPRVRTPQPTWTKVASFPLLARSEQTAVFTGHEVIMWGGRAQSVGNVAPAAGAVPRDAMADGAAYDPATNSWGVLPSAPIGARYGAVSAWTGEEMLVVGGRRDGTGPGGGTEFLRDGAAYDPATRHWRRIADAPECPFFGTWTGKELVVEGTCANTPMVMSAYDPRRNTWTALPPFQGTRQLVSARGRVYAWNATTRRGYVLDRPARKWRALPPLASQYQMGSFIAAYDGHLAVAGYLQNPTENFGHATVDILDADGQAWRHYETTGVTPMIEGSEIASGPGLLVWSSGIDVTAFAVSPETGRAEWLRVGESAELGGTGESLVSIGDRRFLIEGGLLASRGGGAVNQPTPGGAILQLP